MSVSLQDSALSLLPPLVAIVIAVWRRNALFALFSGIVLCYLIIYQSSPLLALT